MKERADNTQPPQWRKNRRPRLDPAVYGHSGYAVHVVANTSEGLPVFADPEIAKQLAATLLEVAGQYGLTVHCLCIMPEHVHAVVSVRTGGKSVPEFVKLFKARATCRLRERLAARYGSAAFTIRWFGGTRTCERSAYTSCRTPRRVGW